MRDRYTFYTGPAAIEALATLRTLPTGKDARLCVSARDFNTAKLSGLTVRRRPMR
ncbi:MAG: hypothetical protein WAO78_12990 [Roseovarius sp.]